MVILAVTGLFLGRYRLRTGGGRVYVHIPVKLVEEINRRVRVTAVINALACNNRILHGSLVSFSATLVEAGGTYRLYIPSRYASALKEVVDCAELDVWVANLGRPSRRGA